MLACDRPQNIRARGAGPLAASCASLARFCRRRRPPPHAVALQVLVVKRRGAPPQRVLRRTSTQGDPALQRRATQEERERANCVRAWPTSAALRKRNPTLLEADHLPSMGRTSFAAPAPAGVPPKPAPPSAPAPPRAATLESLPQEVLLHIVTHVHDAGHHHTQALAQTSRRLAEAVREVGPRGDTALPAGLARRAQRPAPCGIALRAGRDGRLTLRKTTAPGDAFVVFDRCVAATSAYWRFRIDRFAGHRIEVGVASPAALRYGTVERAASWSFDCFGRVCLAGKRLPYGRQMREGDVVGVLCDAKTGTVSFLDNGVCMGAVPVGPPDGPRPHLLPFVYMPYVAGEQVTLLEGCGPLSVRAVRARGRLWRRPAGLPYDGAVIVKTWEPRVWYAIRVDPDVTTVAGFWGLVEQRHGVARHLFELICAGERLVDTDALTLSDVGIRIDERSGTCRSDVLLSVPHIIS